MKHKTLAGTLAVLAIVVLLNMAQARSAPSASASSLGPGMRCSNCISSRANPR